MPSTISAGTTAGTAIAIAGDTTGNLAFQTNGTTTAMTINTSQGVSVLNCLAVGNATPSTSGAGITFPATQSASSDANTLDDYEEGTWTPTNNGDATGNLSGATGEYVKVGRIVYVRGCVTVSSNFTNHILGGLPFTFSGANTVSGITGGCVAFNSSAATLFATPATDSTQIYFYTNANTANQNGLNTTNATIRFYFVYRTSS